MCSVLTMPMPETVRGSAKSVVENQHLQVQRIRDGQLELPHLRSHTGFMRQAGRFLMEMIWNVG
jgi:hypothetical protein